MIVMKITKLIPVIVSSMLLFGCGGSSGDVGGSSTVYKVVYTDNLNVFESASTEFDVLVEQSQEGFSTSAADGNEVTYSVVAEPNENIAVTNYCQNIAIGKSCKLMVSLKKQAANVEKFNFMIKLSNGISRSESVSFKKSRLEVNVKSQEVLPVNDSNYVSITNTSKTAAYFDKPYFTDAENKQISSVLISDNTCLKELKSGQNCHFLVEENNNGVTGQLKLDLGRDPLADIGFSDVAVTGTRTQNIPTNAAKGVTYPFTYTFTNTNTSLPATGVNFNKSFSSGDFIIDTANSSCNGITSIAANSSCTWQGTFTPGSDGHKVMSATLHYNEGSNVTLTSSSEVTTVVVTGTKTQDIPTNAAKGVTYPFSYTFTNTNTSLPATGVSFINSFPVADFTIDEASSSCSAITSIAANSSCTWQGTFTPGSGGHKVMSATLHYNEGSNVTLISSSLALLATAPINTAPSAAENGWAWPSPRFEPAKKADNTPCNDAEYDKLTGLMWVKDGNAAGQKNWNQATSYANNLTLCGYTDWRLPTANELSSFVNYSDTVSPANWLNANGFSNIQDSAYWSSTVYSSSSADAWYVNMADGDMSIILQAAPYDFVLPVRGPN